MKKNILKKVFSGTLCVMLVVSLLPMSVFTANASTLDGTPIRGEDGYELSLSNNNKLRFYNVLNSEESIVTMDKTE